MALEILTGPSVFINAFNNGNPDGADGKDEGDNHIKGIKNVLINTLGNINAAVLSSHAELNQIDGRSFASNGSKIDNFASNITMLFQTTSAPIGWVKETDHNDKSLRVVSGDLIDGGNDAFTTTFGKTYTDYHTLTHEQSGLPAHAHTFTNFIFVGGTPNNSLDVQYGGGVQGRQDRWTNYTGGLDATDGHRHAVEMRVHYVDIIFAHKA